MTFDGIVVFYYLCGMKHLLAVIVTAMVLVAVVTGCGGAGRYDARLVAADSLMQPDPDSALALVQAVPPGSLTREGDRAYRDLLLTQARYKCYITATSDSDINRALDYYRRHSGEREKLTRAYIYKGAVMEELGHPDSAMFYYKHAEATAAPDDYFNLGYCNMRMGDLYRDNYSIDGKDIEKYEEAYYYLKLTNDKHLFLVCMINLGSLYRLNDYNKAESMLHDAMSLALQAKDTVNHIACAQNLIAMYEHYEIYEKARKLINHVITFPKHKINNIFYVNSAKVYAKLAMLDSADYFFNLIELKAINEPIDRLSYFECLSEVYLAHGDQMKHLQYEYQCKQLSDSLKSLQKTITILNSEQKFDQVAKKSLKHQHKVNIFKVLGLCLTILALLSVFIYRHKHRYDRIIADFKQQSENQLNDLFELQQNINNLKISDNQLKSFISSHIKLLREIIEACYHAPHSNLAKDISHLVVFQDNNKDKWEKLYDYIDMEYNGIMSNTKSDHPQLNDKDLLLLALTIMGYSCAQIAIILGYSNATTIGGNRARLAKKMGLEGSLYDYIQRFR